jgi:hypothetical protein
MFRRGDRRDKGDAAQESERDSLVDDGTELGEDELDDDLEDGDLEDGDLEDQPEDMTADLQSQAADYLAGNDVWMYGPNAGAVLEILDRLEEISPTEARPLAEAWLAIPKSDRELARKAVRKLYESDNETARHLQLVREAVGTWMAVTAGYPEYVNAEPDWSRVCTQTGEAALDAATAVILEEVLDESHFEALFAPWSETTAQLDATAAAARLEASGPGETEEVDGVDDGEEEEDAEDEAAFGPNSDAVTDFLNRLWLLTPEQVGRLVGGWQNAPREDLHQAHQSLQELVDEDPEWREQIRHAQEKLGPWLNASRIQETAGFLGQAGQGESRKMAGPALADAVAALVLGDLLVPEDAEVLYGAWFNLIGAPPLPEPAEQEAPKAAGKSPAKGAAGSKPAPGGKGSAKPPAPTTTKGSTKPPAPTTTKLSTKAPAPAKVKTPAKAPAPAKVKTPTKAPAPAKVKTPAKAPAPAEVKTPAKAQGAVGGKSAPGSKGSTKAHGSTKAQGSTKK